MQLYDRGYGHSFLTKTVGLEKWEMPRIWGHREIISGWIFSFFWLFLFLSERLHHEESPVGKISGIF